MYGPAAAPALDSGPASGTDSFGLYSTVLSDEAQAVIPCTQSDQKP